MTVLSVVLFLHLLGAVSLFIAYGIEWTASSLFRNASSLEQARCWLRVFKVSPTLSGVGLGVVLLSGGYLASLSRAMKQGWISAALIGIFVALVLGFALILPRMKRIRRALPSGPAGNGSPSDQLRERLSDPVLLTAIRVRVLLVTGIVYLMAAKIPLVPSLVTLTIAVVLGVILSIPTWSQAKTATAKA
jgi:hypothetical protein